MLLIVRTRDQLKDSIAKLSTTARPAMGFAVSRLNYHKLQITGDEDGIILTSPSAALAVPPTRLPIYCVGEKTADEAKSLGHRVIFDGAKGNAEDMAKTILSRYPVQNLVHAAGDTADEAWYELLTAHGFKMLKKEVYSTEYVAELDADTLKALKEKRITHVALFSAQGATHFLTLCQNAGIDLNQVTAVAFSKQIGSVCRGFKAVYACPEPTLDLMKRVLERV